MREPSMEVGRRGSTRRLGADFGGDAQGPMMTSPIAGGRAGLAWPHRLHTLARARRRPPQEGVEQVTRSMATNRAQVSLELGQTAAMRARVKGSLLTNGMDRERPETGAVAGGGRQPQQDGLEKIENGDCDTVGAKSCWVQAGSTNQRHETKPGTGPGLEEGSKSEVSERLGWLAGTDVRGQTLIVLSGL